MNLPLLAVFVSLCYATKEFGTHCLSDILFQPNIFFQTSKMNSSFFLSITRTFFQLSLTDGFSSVYESLFDFLKIKIWGDFNNIVRQFCRVWSWILRAEYRCDRAVTNMGKDFFHSEENHESLNYPKRKRLLDPSMANTILKLSKTKK